MAIKLQPAKKYIKPLKVLMYGPTYSGKTYSSLQLAAGVVAEKRGCKVEDAWKHIILIDSEFGRGALYNNMGPYNYHQIEAPYTSEKLHRVLLELKDVDQIDVIIIDSLTHYWSKDGGILDQKAAKDKQGGNSYTNWQEFTAKFNKLVDEILSSPKHIFATTRAKSDTVLLTDSGKAVPKSYGLKPELRDGIEYDFDIVFNIDKDSHELITDKAVPGIEQFYAPATPELGKSMFQIFNTDAVVKERTVNDIIDNIRRTSRDNNLIQFVQLELSGRKLDKLSLEDLTKLEKAIVKELKSKQRK